MRYSQGKIAIVDYGMGNIRSVCHSLDLLGGKYFITGDRNKLSCADAYILPGVGAFGAAMENIRRGDILPILTEEVMVKKKPFFGICLGMQLLAVDSLEMGLHKGFGWIDGHVLPLRPKDGLRVPHVGWNNIEALKPEPLFNRILKDAHFYFDHSFYLDCETSIISSKFTYGGSFVASIQKENIYAMQFHPEKSQRTGLKMLRNFLNLIEGKRQSDA